MDFLAGAEKRFSLGLESNVAKHFGYQDHWEFNLPVLITSWDKFPWEDTVEQSLEFGMGPSMTTELPRTEEEINESSQHLMLYWHLETSFARPGSPWEVLFRLHHRSTAYGVFGEEGGSNALTTGLRYRF
jgi:phytoene dehydrogenase-like protein